MSYDCVLQLTDERSRKTNVFIYYSDGDWDQRSIHDHSPMMTVGSGSGSYTRLMNLFNLVDGEHGYNIVQLEVDSFPFRRGAEGGGTCDGAGPALKDGIVKWECLYVG